MGNKITLSISKELNEKLNEKIKETDFKTIQDYIIYFLEQFLFDLETEKSSDNEPYTEEEEESLKKNLASLGYI